MAGAGERGAGAGAPSQQHEAYNQRGSLLHALGRLDEAAHSLRQALALLPEYADAHHHLGLLLAAAGQSEEALHSHDQAIALQPQWHEAHASRAVVLRELGRRDDAQRATATANQLRRYQLAAYRSVGDELLAQGRAAAGRQRHRTVAAPCAHAECGRAARKALASIGRALALKPEGVEFQLTRGVILRGAARYEEAPLR